MAFPHPSIPQTDEEGLVHVCVSGILQEDLSTLSRDQFSFLDLQSSAPLVTIGSQAFVGTFEDTIGSSVFFSQAPNTVVKDAVFGKEPATQVAYLASTRKKLQLKRVFLNKKPVVKEPEGEVKKQEGEVKSTPVTPEAS